MFKVTYSKLNIESNTFNHSYRYSYIVHPLAYRASTDTLPDNCCVDAIQWCILNIVEEPHYNNPDMWYNPCLGLELFNDFTYNVSYNSELSKTVHDCPEFVIPCYNGKIFFDRHL